MSKKDKRSASREEIEIKEEESSLSTEQNTDAKNKGHQFFGVNEKSPDDVSNLGSEEIDEPKIDSTENESAKLSVRHEGKRKRERKAKRAEKEIVKMKNGKTKLPKKSFKQRMKTLGVLIVLGVFTGSGLGVWYFNTALRSNVDYNALFSEIEKYTVTPESVLQELFGMQSGYENWLDTAKSKGLKPANLTPAQNFILAEYNGSLADSFLFTGNGKVATIATQSVYSSKRFNGERYTFESISKGMLTIATCSAMNKGASSVDVFKGQNVTPTSAEWQKDQTYTEEGYIDYAGGLPSAIQPYIINDNTILSSSEIVYDEATDTYSFTVELDPVLSVLRYARQVKQTSGLSTYPEFSSVTQTIVIDSDWTLVSTDILETYTVVAFGLKNSCTGTLLTEFQFNVDVELPV